MDFNVQNMADLITAIQSASAGEPANIKITASFPITQPLSIESGAIVDMTSTLNPHPVLTRAVNLTLEMFRVYPNGNLSISNLVLDGNRNDAATTASLILNRGTLNLYNATLRNNSSYGNGGAVYGLSGQITAIDTMFLNNHSNLDGGAIISNDRIILDNSTFINNTANGNGGGMYYDGGVNLGVNNSKFESNTAMNGGGIYIALRNDGIRFDILKESVFIGNRATGDGGAIWVYDLASLYVEQPVIFSNNRAWQGYFIDPADIPLHETHIFATVFTNPFQYGYNNFDINYKSNMPYDEDADCNVVGTQTVDLCVPVTVTPTAIAGPTIVRCCGPAIITPGTNICPGAPIADCSFTITQRLCVEVPVEFRANATAGQTHTKCGDASGDRTCTGCAGSPEGKS